MHKRSKRLFQDHKTNILITNYALKHCTKHLVFIYIFDNELFRTKEILQGQQADTVGFRAFFLAG